MDILSILIAAALAIWFAAGVISMIKNKGGCSCGCGKSSSKDNCGCNGCGTCQGCRRCNRTDKCDKGKKIK